MHDLVIRGATVVDGLGGEPVSADVAVKDGRIAAVGVLGPPPPHGSPVPAAAVLCGGAFYFGGAASAPAGGWGARVDGRGNAGLAMARLDINMTSFDVFWTNMLQGFGFGLSYTPMAVLAFSTLAPRLTTEGSAVFNMMRNIGSSAFISLSVLVLVIGTAESYAGLSEGITPFNELLRYPLLAGAFADDTAAGLAAAGVEVRRQAAMVGYLNAFWLFTAAAALAVPLVALFKVAPAAGR